MFVAASDSIASRQNRAWLPRFAQRGWRVLAGCLCLASVAVQAAEGKVSKEYQVKAAFLYNFTKFVEWPPARFADKSSPIVIGLLGPNQIGDELVNIVAGRKANGRNLVVKEITSLAETGPVQVVFIGAGEDLALHELLPVLHAAGILTVGESPQFTAAGGMITFVLEADKVRFEINRDASEQAGLKISAQLLKLATAVHHKS